MCHRLVTFIFCRMSQRPYITKLCPVLVSSVKEKYWKINPTITAMQFLEAWDTDSRWRCVKYILKIKYQHHETQQENLLVTALGLHPYSLSRQRQYKQQRLNCPWANSAQLFKRRKRPTLFPPLYTQAGVRHSVAAVRQGWCKLMSGIGWLRQGDGRAAAILCEFALWMMAEVATNGVNVQTSCETALSLSGYAWAVLEKLA